MKILVSACLLGTECRYDGSGGINESVLELSDKYQLIPVCPEQLGGLPTPRKPAEISNGLVIDRDGLDVTAQFRKGAEEVLKLGKLFHCSHAILKSRSPSCGCGKVYDGTFTGNLISGDGLTTELLIQNGIKVINDEEIDLL